MKKSRPRVTLRETGHPSHLPVLLDAAKGFALLGCDVVLSCCAAESVERSRRGGQISISYDEQWLSGTISFEGPRATLTLEGAPDISGPAGRDVYSHQDITRWQARALLGFDNDMFAVALLAHANDEALDALFDLVANADMGRPVTVILCRGELDDARLSRHGVLDLRQTFDTQSWRYVVAAADAVVNLAEQDHGLAIAAAILWAPVLGREEISTHLSELVSRPMALNKMLNEQRNGVLAWQSNEAFAISFREQAERLLAQTPIGLWLSKRDCLATGAIELRTDSLRLLNSKKSCSLTPITGASWTLHISDDGLQNEVIACQSSGALLALDVRMTHVQAIYVKVYVEQAGTIEIRIDGTPSMSRWIEGAGEHELTFEAALEPGTHRCLLRQLTDGGAADMLVLETELLAMAMAQRCAAIGPSSFIFMPCRGRETAICREDGDWKRIDGFYAADNAHPHFGLHDAFRWSGKTFKIGLWSARTASRPLVVVARGNHTGQRLRLSSSGVDYGWSRPLGGLLASCHKRRWLVELAEGFNTLVFETSSTTGAGSEREIGVILQRIYIDD